MADSGLVKGTPRHYHHKYKFVVEIGNLGQMQFQSCSELKMEIAKIEYYEGGVIVPFKEAGRITVSDLTLERAAAYDPAVYNWIVQTATAATNYGAASNQYKRSGWIIQLDRDNSVLREWQLFGLWPMSYTGGAWDNNADELTMESVTLALDYFVLRRDKATASDGGPLSDLAKAIETGRVF